MWDLPGSGIKPVSPTLAGRFFTTEPPGKPTNLIFFNFIYFGCAGSSLLCGLFPAALIGGFSLVGVCRLPIAMASLVGAQRPVLASVAAAPRLWSTGPIIVSHGLSCSESRRIFPDQGSNLLHWQAYSLPLSQGSPIPTLFRRAHFVIFLNQTAFFKSSENWNTDVFQEGNTYATGRPG